LALAEKVGHNMRGGEVIELVSDLGGGKTAFVRGLARGLGSTESVHSPSFTLSNRYQADKLTLYHFDFYRLEEPGIMKDELAEVLDDPQAVVAVEWGKIVDDVLPPQRLIIRIDVPAADRRELIFSYPASLEYLIPNNT
jgi:tRNA threonylcarbamoyladenosine biosynthesis protein TsaE